MEKQFICSIYIDRVEICSLRYSYLHESVTARENVLVFFDSNYWTVSSFKEYKNFIDLGCGSALYL